MGGDPRSPRLSARLVLASGSPRRRELLTSIGVDFEVRPADVDESWSAGERPTDYVERVALAKSAAVAGSLGTAHDVCVLSADTTVDLGGDILAKPVDDDDARRMLSSLSGRIHQVHTAVVGRRVGGGDTTLVSTVVSTAVTFASLAPADIEWYLSFGEHLDKAGAYGMQSAGGALVERIDGSPSNVIGLPLAETIGVLRSCGVHIAG